MIEAQSREIDGTTYVFTPLMATKARALLDQLIQRFGEPVGKAVEALDRAEQLSLDADTANTTQMLGQMAAPVGAAISGLASKLDPAFHAKLVSDLAANTLVETENGQVPLSKSLLETHFATRLLSETKWIGFCLECQYSDFLDLFKSSAVQAIALKAMANSPSKSQTASTGGSSE